MYGTAKPWYCQRMRASLFGQVQLELWQDEPAAAEFRAMLTDRLKQFAQEADRTLQGRIDEKIQFFEVVEDGTIPVAEEEALRPPPKVTLFGRLLQWLRLRPPPPEPPVIMVGITVSSETVAEP